MCVCILFQILSRYRLLQDGEWSSQYSTAAQEGLQQQMSAARSGPRSPRLSEERRGSAPWASSVTADMGMCSKATCPNFSSGGGVESLVTPPRLNHLKSFSSPPNLMFICSASNKYSLWADYL